MKYSALILSLFLLSCGSSSQTLLVKDLGWAGDSISFQLTSLAGAPQSGIEAKIECTSCKLADKPVEVKSNASGKVALVIPEAPHLVTTRLKVKGSGIDTNVVLTQRPGSEAVRYYALKRPILGRVLVNQYAVLYKDSTQEEIVDQVRGGDELNTFGETEVFYLVHHPIYSQPVYLLKSNAKRMF